MREIGQQVIVVKIRVKCLCLDLFERKVWDKDIGVGSLLEYGLGGRNEGRERVIQEMQSS